MADLPLEVIGRVPTMSERGPAERRNAYERACADLLMRLGDWRTMRDLGALPGQLASLKASGLIVSSPDFRSYSVSVARNHPLVYRRTNAGDRAVDLIRAVLPPEGE